MEHVDIDPHTGRVSWDEYFRYLERNKDKFPRTLYEYAANWDHYSLDSHSSLHDAWLENIAFGPRPGNSRVGSLTLTFLGAFHDRRHTFSYSGVHSFSIDLASSEQPGYRDLLAHEFRTGNGHFVHEMRFAGGGAVSIAFESITILQQPLSPDR